MIGPDQALLDEQARTGKAPRFSKDDGEGSPDDDLYDGLDFDEEVDDEGEVASDNSAASTYSVEAPAAYVYNHEFRRYMRWTREKDWNNQADDYVDQSWRVYQLKVKYGVLDRERGL